jgi:RNA polymerase sigma-70 factor (ECF subfamily)
MHELLHRIAAKDARALEELYGRLARPLFGVIFSIVKDKEDAEEILLDAFLQVWDKAASYDMRKGSVWGWLLALARNRAIDKVRSKVFKNRARETGTEEELETAAPEAPDPYHLMDHARRMARITEAMGRISPEHRCVLEAAYFEGRSQSEVAKHLGMPLGTVKTRMRDAMRHLQILLKGLV